MTNRDGRDQRPAPETASTPAARELPPPPRVDERPVFDLFAAHVQSRITEIALRLGLFEALSTPRSIDSLRRHLAIGHQAIEATLAVLAGCGLITLSTGMVALTPLAEEYLVERSPFFKGPMFCLITPDEMDLIRQVHLQDGLPRPETARWLVGKVLAPGQQAAEMHAHTFAAAATFARAPDLPALSTLLDVGGGVGTSSIAFALGNRALHATIMDLPDMRQEAESLIHRYGVADQVAFLGADMFQDTWPTGYDGVLFSNILHDWSDERCATLAANAYAALKPGGAIIVNEMLLDRGRDGPLGVALFSAIMLLKMEGRQWTLHDLTTLLTTAGFCAVRPIGTFGYYTLVLAEKPER